YDLLAKREVYPSSGVDVGPIVFCSANAGKEHAMKEGHRFVDCDMHIMEPIDLFDKYLDPAFKDRITSSQRRVEGGSTGMRGRPLWFCDGAPLSNDGNISQYNRTRGPLVSGRANKIVMFAVERGYDEIG